MKETADGSINVLCGMVNAKNAFGGYPGPTPFTAFKAKRETETIVDVTSTASCENEMRVAEEIAREQSKR
jgi:hypothetical protein